VKVPVREALYPVGMVLAGRRCVVVGGGSVAARKVAGLLSARAQVVVVAPYICDQIRETPAKLVERAYASHDLDDAWLAIAATDDPAINRQVHADGELARVWVNAVDDPEECAFEW
jgi:siroheme synthase-like protein